MNIRNLRGVTGVLLASCEGVGYLMDGDRVGWIRGTMIFSAVHSAPCRPAGARSAGAGAPHSGRVFLEVIRPYTRQTMWYLRSTPVEIPIAHFVVIDSFFRAKRR
ncbi:hypothetical protein EVAR_22559_1 [Eumeta japonica]|uniref:Uncharacterized protein n=1 Tax=Eumeta variegata TaxID=151549 RepID=A0A4C1U798_EUMVA|nr:hypothetical protein EVAR_22559_1 [Eumeta japonica]